MEKRIIAVICVVMLLTVLLASCGQKYQMINIKGKDYPVVTDAEGSTEINQDGQIAVYVTDENGKMVTNADGSGQKNYYDLPDVLINGLNVETLDYKFSMPDSWELDSTGKFTKKNTDGKCTVQISLAKEIAEDSYETFDTYVDEITIKNEDYVRQFNENGHDTTMDKTTFNLADGRVVRSLTFKIIDADGNIIHYAQTAYFAIGRNIYLANYMCDGGTGYDEEFNFSQIITENLIIK